ncbi:MAG: hypothetical protein DMD70_08790 [Gemmatimonadetes bacterium]|nr:MAG: hypothetical protein DMD70_08790 [Gemmatimonadota bacterium]
MVHLPRQLTDFLREPGEVGERGEVSFFILADPPIDRLLGFAQGHGRLRAIVKAELPPLVAPFRGERYAAKELSALIAPPYDVISREDRTRYAARDPHNIAHLILPEAPSGGVRGGGGDRYAHAATLLAAWREAGVVRPDPAESVYIVAQDYAVPSGERRTRIGMLAAVRAEPFETRRVRPHEQTHAAPKADRLALLRATAANLESIFLLAPDPDRMLAQALVRRASGVPAARAELDGVGIRLWVTSGDQAAELARLAGRAQLYIADGHHRYETAVAYAREEPSADHVLSFVVSAGDPGLTILPTHRIIFGAGRDATKLVAAWREWFEVGRVAPCMDRVERLAELGRERTACIVAFPDAYDVTLVLKNDAPLDDVSDLATTPAVRALDVARIESLVVQRILGAGTATPSLAYTPDPHAAFDAVRHGRAAAAVLLNPTKVRDVFAVADAGDVMPPKSTYFVPKVPSGLVIRAV